MDKLKLLSQDKATLMALKEFFKQTLESEIVNKTLKKEDTSGYAEASEIISKSLKKIEDLSKENKKGKYINQSE